MPREHVTGTDWGHEPPVAARASEPNNILSHDRARAKPIGADNRAERGAGGGAVAGGGGSASNGGAAPTAGPRAEQLARLSEYLAAPDRAMIRAIYTHGHSLREVGRLMQVTPDVVRRRLRRLSRRMQTPEFAFVALRHEHWPPRLAQVSRACVLEGQSLRSAAVALNLSVHAVRRVRDQALAMAKAADDLKALAARVTREAPIDLTPGASDADPLR